MGCERIDGITRGLRRALAPYAATVETLAITPWASATFTGSRRRLLMACAAARDAEALADALPELDFTLRGAIVAEAVVRERSERTVTAELLLIDDA